MAVGRFIVRRLIAGAALLLVLSLLIFGMLTAGPGTPLQSLLGTRAATPELVAQLRRQYHLDEPFVEQYLHWLVGVAHLDFGQSISVRAGTPVSSLITGRMAITVQLAVYCLLLVLLIGIPLGLIAGVRRGRTADRAITLLATAGLGAPVFAVSIVLLYVFGVELAWFPVYGAGTGFVERIEHLTLPAVTLGIALSALVIRQVRAAAQEVMRQDHLTFARLRGLSPLRITARYVLPACALPIVTSAGVLLIAPLSAGVFIEQAFSLPGEGSLLLNAVNAKDIPVVQGLALSVGAFVIVVNLLVDLASYLLDPRLRAHAAGES